MVFMDFGHSINQTGRAELIIFKVNKVKKQRKAAD